MDETFKRWISEVYVESRLGHFQTLPICKVHRVDLFTPPSCSVEKTWGPQTKVIVQSGWPI